jgi:hypothetical protein
VVYGALRVQYLHNSRESNLPRTYFRFHVLARVQGASFAGGVTDEGSQGADPGVVTETKKKK